jgi:hypothetical protein
VKIAVLFFLFLILGGLYLYQNFTPKEESDESSQIIQVGEVSLYAPDQKPGNSVNISIVNLTKPGYIVIHEADNQGEFGRIIGNSFIIPAGESENIFVGLIRPSVSGEFLYAIIYEDSGDGFFTPELDVPFKDEAGNVIFMRFRVDRASSDININLK